MFRLAKALAAVAVWMAVFAGVGVSAVAQTAKVVELSAADAKLAKDLYAQKAAIEKQIADLETKVRRVYLAADKNKMTTCSSSDGVRIASGWGCGEFTYSEDFRFVVPGPTSHLSLNNPWSGCVVNTPAYATSSGVLLPNNLIIY